MANDNNIVKIMIPTLDGYVSMNLDSIIYLSADSSSTWIHFMAENIYVPRTLGHFEESLTEHYFQRIHNSYLVNMKAIHSIKKGRTHKVTMINGDELAISDSKKDSFLEKLNEIVVMI